MQAIVTKFIGPTNYRGSRVKAKAYAGVVTIPWDDALDVDANHEMAAKALAKKFGWPTDFCSGGMPDNSGNVYVMKGRRSGAKRVLRTRKRVTLSVSKWPSGFVDKYEDRPPIWEKMSIEQFAQLHKVSPRKARYTRTRTRR